MEANGLRQQVTFLERFRDEQREENRRVWEKVGALDKEAAVTQAAIKEIQEDVRSIKGLIRWAIATFLGSATLIVTVVSVVAGR